MAIFTLTINTPAGNAFGDLQSQERALIGKALDNAKQAIGDGVSFSGDVTQAGHVVIGSWAYNPVARS